MTKAQQLSMTIKNITPRIQANVDTLKARGNESAMIDRINEDIDLIQVICGGVANDQID